MEDFPPDIGRPLTHPSQRLVQRSGRMTQSQWAKVKAGGGFVWLRYLVDQAAWPEVPMEEPVPERKKRVRKAEVSADEPVAPAVEKMAAAKASAPAKRAAKSTSRAEANKAPKG